MRSKRLLSSLACALVVTSFLCALSGVAITAFLRAERPARNGRKTPRQPRARPHAPDFRRTLAKG